MKNLLCYAGLYCEVCWLFYLKEGHCIAPWIRELRPDVNGDKDGWQRGERHEHDREVSEVTTAVYLLSHIKYAHTLAPSRPLSLQCVPGSPGLTPVFVVFLF